MLRHPRCVMARTKECFSFSARPGMFHPYYSRRGEFLGLASLWSIGNRWLWSWQPLRHVARFVAPSTLVKERLLRRASACLCLKHFPGFRTWMWANVDFRIRWVKNLKIFCKKMYIFLRISRLSKLSKFQKENLRLLKTVLFTEKIFCFKFFKI